MTRLLPISCCLSPTATKIYRSPSTFVFDTREAGLLTFGSFLEISLAAGPMVGLAMSVGKRVTVPD